MKCDILIPPPQEPAINYTFQQPTIQPDNHRALEKAKWLTFSQNCSYSITFMHKGLPTLVFKVKLLQKLQVIWKTAWIREVARIVQTKAGPQISGKQHQNATLVCWTTQLLNLVFTDYTGQRPCWVFAIRVWNHPVLQQLCSAIIST